MKTTIRTWMMPALWAAGCGIAALLAEDKELNPFDHPELGEVRMIQVRVEFVEMSHAKLTELLFHEEPETSDATALRETVAKLVKGGEATILETMMITASGGKSAKTESVREFIYPTEYEPPEIPTEVDLPDKKGGLTPDDIKALWMMATPATPTAFETRHLGSTLEVEATLAAAHKQIDLTLCPEIVWHTGNIIWAERKDGLGNVSRIEMPAFYTISIRTAVTCVDGQYCLMAALSPKDQNGVTDFTRKVMVFVRCDIVNVRP
jgi:hypothetical protein